MGFCYGQSSLETNYVQRKSCVQGHSRVGVVSPGTAAVSHGEGAKGTGLVCHAMEKEQRGQGWSVMLWNRAELAGA